MAQKQYVRGKEYTVEGPSGEKRRMIHVATYTPLDPAVKHHIFRHRTDGEIRKARRKG